MRNETEQKFGFYILNFLFEKKINIFLNKHMSLFSRFKSSLN